MIVMKWNVFLSSVFFSVVVVKILSLMTMKIFIFAKMSYRIKWMNVFFRHREKNKCYSSFEKKISNQICFLSLQTLHHYVWLMWYINDDHDFQTLFFPFLEQQTKRWCFFPILIAEFLNYIYIKTQAYINSTKKTSFNYRIILEKKFQFPILPAKKNKIHFLHFKFSFLESILLNGNCCLFVFDWIFSHYKCLKILQIKHYDNDAINDVVLFIYRSKLNTRKIHSQILLLSFINSVIIQKKWCQIFIYLFLSKRNSNSIQFNRLTLS